RIAQTAAASPLKMDDGCSSVDRTLIFQRSSNNERSECKPDRAQPSRNERSECKPDAKRKRDSGQPQEMAQPSRNDATILCSTYPHCVSDAGRRADQGNMDPAQDAMGRSGPARPVAGRSEHTDATARQLRYTSFSDRRGTHSKGAASATAARVRQ